MVLGTGERSSSGRRTFTRASTGRRRGAIPPTPDVARLGRMRNTPRRTTAALAVTLATALALGAAPASAAPEGHHRSFDLQAHRGGIALTVENTLPAFDNALALG